MRICWVIESCTSVHRSLSGRTCNLNADHCKWHTLLMTMRLSFIWLNIVFNLDDNITQGHMTNTGPQTVSLAPYSAFPGDSYQYSRFSFTDVRNKQLHRDSRGLYWVHYGAVWSPIMRETPSIEINSGTITLSRTTTNIQDQEVDHSWYWYRSPHTGVKLNTVKDNLMWQDSCIDISLLRVDNTERCCYNVYTVHPAERPMSEWLKFSVP